MPQFLLVVLLLAVVVVAAYFYLKRAQARTATPVETAAAPPVLDQETSEHESIDR